MQRFFSNLNGHQFNTNLVENVTQLDEKKKAYKFLAKQNEIN